MALLLTESDARAIDGLADVVAQDINEVPVFENPDPRGPCGGPAPSPPISGGSARVFTNSNTSILQFVAEASTETDQYLAALIADRVESCGPFDSTTNVGSTQTTSQIEFVDLASVDGTGIAWTARADVGVTGAYVGIGAIAGNGHLALIQAQSLSPIEAATLLALVEGAAARLSG